MASLFQAVTQTMHENQARLNEADNYNHDHGDNMVDVFSTITKAIEQKPRSSPDKQLAHASKVLRKSSTSGSAAMYSDSLLNASKTMGRDGLTLENAMPFLQTLLGGSVAQPPQPVATPAKPARPAKRPAKPRPGEQQDTLSTLLAGMDNAQQLPQGSAPQTASTGGGDLLSTLLGQMTASSQAPSQAQPQTASGGDLLSTLLGGMGEVSAPQQQQQQSLPEGDLLTTLLGQMMSGSGQAQSQQQPAGGDLMGSLLTSMMGAGSSAGQSDPSGDLIGSLFGSLAGGGASQNNQAAQNSGIDIMDLIRMGLGYMNAKKQGKSTIEALVASVLSNSQSGHQGYRKDSGELIANTVFQMLGAGAR